MDPSTSYSPLPLIAILLFYNFYVRLKSSLLSLYRCAFFNCHPGNRPRNKCELIWLTTSNKSTYNEHKKSRNHYLFRAASWPLCVKAGRIGADQHTFTDGTIPYRL